jgi:hypothetical protein
VTSVLVVWLREIDLYCWSLAAPSDLGMYFGTFCEGVIFVVERWLEGKDRRAGGRKGGL